MGTWWIDEDLLLGSSNPTNVDLERLRVEGFGVIVSLLNETEQRPNYNEARALKLGYTRHSIPIKDLHAPSLEQLHEFTRVIAGVKEDSKVLVHCESGSGRTGTMAAAYWVSEGLRPSQAVAKIRQRNPHAVETTKQRAILEEFSRERSRVTGAEAAQEVTWPNEST